MGKVGPTVPRSAQETVPLTSEGHRRGLTRSVAGRRRTVQDAPQPASDGWASPGPLVERAGVCQLVALDFGWVRS